MSSLGWEFWRLTQAGDGALAWLAATRPDARSAIDRKKLWTLLSSRRLLIANWYVTKDHWQSESGTSLWVHEEVDVGEAREIALEVPEPDALDLARLTRPEKYLTLDQIDRHPVEKILGKRVADALAARR